jgi:hypothetical protein
MALGFTGIFHEPYPGCARMEKLTVENQRHRDDGDPQANARGKQQAEISASYIYELVKSSTAG